LKSFNTTCSLCLLAAACARAGDVEWSVNGGPYNIRYSPLAQVNRENVGRLQLAWTYDSHDSFKGSEMQSNPIVVDKVLYATTPTMQVVALNAETGREPGTVTAVSRSTKIGCSSPIAISSSHSTSAAASR